MNSMERLVQDIVDAYARLEKENADMRRENARLAQQSGDLCDRIFDLEQKLKGAS